MRAALEVCRAVSGCRPVPTAVPTTNCPCAITGVPNAKPPGATAAPAAAGPNALEPRPDSPTNPAASAVPAAPVTAPEAAPQLPSSVAVAPPTVTVYRGRGNMCACRMWLGLLPCSIDLWNSGWASESPSWLAPRCRKAPGIMAAGTAVKHISTELERTLAACHFQLLEPHTRLPLLCFWHPGRTVTRHAFY